MDQSKVFRYVSVHVLPQGIGVNLGRNSGKTHAKQGCNHLTGREPRCSVLGLDHKQKGQISQQNRNMIASP